MSARSMKRASAPASAEYSMFSRIDGSHPFKQRAPGGYVEYQVRHRPYGKISYFNFALAKEMGLIRSDHPQMMNPRLQAALLEAFSIQIINEYDIIHSRKFDPATIKANRYMATRYLQMQHPSRNGLTSGDGRSIWNGFHAYRGRAWDITSCGTGATCLSPAHARHGIFYRSGDPSVSYGCGYADLEDGLSNAIFSEIMHRNGVETERTLAVIEFPKGLAITVRAGLNLIRPSHMFNHLKQGRWDRLKNVVDYFIDRQMYNRTWLFEEEKLGRYETLLKNMAHTFASMAAKFESEYIFCWLDWDGDNILANGGIIDYGSVRQFGLFHHEYRFDDVERWSTNIKEQRQKARYMVQVFAQLVDYLNTRAKKPISKFANHKSLKYFDTTFESAKRQLTLEKIGLTSEQAAHLLSRHASTAIEFLRHFAHFERTKSRRGPIKVSDGITWNAVFCMRDLLRELPRVLQASEYEPIEARSFLKIMKSSYAAKADLTLSPTRVWRIGRMQDCYLKLARAVARHEKVDLAVQLQQIQVHSGKINRYDRVTGDGMSIVGETLFKHRRSMPPEQFQDSIDRFIEHQTLIAAEAPKAGTVHRLRRQPVNKRLWDALTEAVVEYREGI